MMPMRIPLSSPDINENDIAAVVAVLRSSRLSLGPVLEDFEQELAGYLKAPHAVAVSSGTAGLHLSLLALGIGAGDEVIVPSFTFIAAANAIRYVGAVPVFVDVDATTLNMDPSLVERLITPRTRALVVVHTFGFPAALTPLLDIARRWDLRVIEDACEAIGAEYKGQRVGTFGDAGVFAFYPNKQITTGEGGMVVAKDAAVAATVRALRNHGRKPTGNWFEHCELGYNYRLAEMNCALGLGQLRRIETILGLRASVAAGYEKQLRDVAELVLPQLHIPDCRISWFVYVVRLAEQFTREQRDQVMRFLTERGIGCGRYFAPIHLQDAYQSVLSAKVSLTVSEAVSERTLALPFFNHISSGQISEVCDSLRDAIWSLTS
jgi:perosamine synthetase